MILLSMFIRRLIRVGRLTIIDHNGKRHEFPGEHEGPSAAIQLHDAKVAGEIARNPRLKVGEAYMDGRLTIPEGTLYDFLEVAVRNLAWHNRTRSRLALKLQKIVTAAQHYNPVGKAQKNVAHHYDLSGELFGLFLDEDRQYSCAYYRDPSDDLESAQEQKKRHIAAKLLLGPGQKVLDIGCGWGGMALFIARETGADVTGLTLSREQHAVATRRAAEAGLADRVRFKLLDYRQETGVYDRIVSVGMFEHVGNLHYGEFFAKLDTLLKPDGVALLHTIGSADVPGPVASWIRKYIFPGGYLPSLSEIAPHLERLGLWMTDFESLRFHYAETLKAWNERFQRHRDHIRDDLYDERFCRMWEFYLQSCEANFRESFLTVFQIQIAKSIAAVPMTRDYMLDWERAHAPDNRAPKQGPMMAAGE
ncbi:MAG: cyclopropane-fatty-acyl-phospholipid synthase [Rhizobiales bacterium NRL2]|mgnify:CR=1 FL=1|jgi:cyclopropane-fatty-acyl-phospholipid synthase|nr:MAG: cyclopropane-fatty-acyl-phospholipid synthase [Rhizobiales bacterium NRL2]